MELKQIEIKNFMSFKKAVYECKKGITFITGKNLTDNATSNGAGKSSFLEAILWCLYGKTMRECAVNDIIHRGENKASVKLIFDVNGKEISIEREKEYGKTDKLKSSYNIDLPEWKMFRLCNVFDKDSASFIASPPSDRQRILDYFVNGEIIDKLYEKVKEKEQRINEKQINLDKELSRIRGQIQEKQNHLNLIKSKNYDEEINQLELKIQETAKNLVPNLTQFEIDYQEKVKRENDLHNLFLQKNEKLLYERNKVQNYESRLEELDQKLEDVKNLRGNCPVCFQPINEGVIHRVDEVINKDKKSITQNLNQHKENIVKFEKEVKRVKEEIELVKREKDEIFAKIQQQKDLLLKINYLAKQLKNYQKLNNEKEKEVQRISVELQSLVDREADIEKELNNIPVELDEIAFFKRNFGSAGFRVWRLNKVINILNKIIQDRSDNIDFNIEFILGENSRGEISRLDIQIKRKDGEITSYEALSGGEKRKVTIIVLLSLNTLLSLYGYNFNFIIFDEIFDTLDDKGVSIIMELLQELREKGRQVFLVSHLDLLKAGDYDNLLEIKKVNGVSTIGEYKE